MAQTFEFGLDTFGDITKGFDGTLLSHAQVVRDVIEEAALADALGVDAFGVGEHHRPDFAVSAPEVVLAAIASRTKRIRLGSAVTVLSSDDPIRVFERFSTLNAASNGRAEVTVGRGSFTESFPLFGLDLAQYEELFEEKLDLFVAVLRNEQVTWQGRLRPPLKNQRVFPPIEHGPLCELGSASAAARNRSCAPQTTICRSRSPSSAAIRSAFAPLSISIIAPSPSSAGRRKTLPFTRPVMLGRPMRRRAKNTGPATRPCTTRSAANAAGRRSAGRNSSKRSSNGSLYVGAPETVARKIASTAKALGIVRFDMKYSAGTLPHASMMQSIELYGKKVMPLVREMLAEAKVPAA